MEDNLNNTDIKNINMVDYSIDSIESNEFGKIFSFKEPYNVDTIEYLEYLFQKNKNDILKLKDYFPIELFEEVHSKIDHFDVDEYKDYSSGSRVNRSERYFTHDSRCEYILINQDNFENFIKICKIILQDNLNTTYEKYVKNTKKLYTYRVEKDDAYYQVKHRIIRYYKFL